MSFQLNVAGQNLQLSSGRALYWTEHEALILSDLHLGKAAHFRKHGIPLPEDSGRDTLARLEWLINAYEPKSVIIIGDLFHSSINRNWKNFINFRMKFDELEMILVRGNHDILNDSDYANASLTLKNTLYLAPFFFIHDPGLQIKEPEGSITVSGHIHPGIRIKGKGRQSISLPCYHLQDNRLILPAFGTLTGIYPVKKKKDNRIFAISDGYVFEV